MFVFDGVHFYKHEVCFSPLDIPNLVGERDVEYNDPPIQTLLAQGAIVLQTQFEEDATSEYCSSVFNWGGGVRNLQRFMENGDGNIAVILRNASSLVIQENGNANSALSVGQAIYSITTLNRIGMSYASKLLRFLHSEHVVIFDSKIREALGYADNAQGYANFHADCIAIRDHPSVANVIQVCGRNCYISDIEAAIFMSIQRTIANR